MTNLLAKGLGLPDTSLNRFVEECESLSGYPSEDSRLVSELIIARRGRISQLGLDPTDTRSQELYQALLISYEQVAQAFARSIGQNAGDNLADRFARIDKVLAQQVGQPIWVIKRAALKKIMVKSPPRRLMKYLHYRTADSLLKREDVRLLFLVSQRVESARWRKQISKDIASLPPSSFEKQPAQALVLPINLWHGLNAKRPLVIGQPEVGLVAVWPNALAKDMTTLGVVALALDAMDGLTNWSGALDFHSLSPDFGKLSVGLWSHQHPVALEIAGRPVSWRSLHIHYGSGLNRQTHPEDIGIEDTKPSPMDLWFASKSLSRLHILLNWWAGNAYQVYVDNAGQAVSLNLSDIAVSHALKAPFSRRTLVAARQGLFDELVTRYLSHPGVSNMIQARLAGDPEEPISRTRRRQRPQLTHQLGNS